MPVSKWPTDAPAPSRPAPPAATAQAAMAQAHRLLGDVRSATERLGAAVEAAGLARHHWERRDAALKALSDELPNVSFDALFARLATFATEAGPEWLAGDGAALNAFEDEAHVLAKLLTHLRRATQQGADPPRRGRARQALARALSDKRAAAPLERLALDLRALVSLAARLEPVPPASPPPPAAAVLGRTAGAGGGNVPPSDAWLLVAPGRDAAPPGHEPAPGTLGLSHEPTREQASTGSGWSSAGASPEEQPEPASALGKLRFLIPHPLPGWASHLRTRRVWAGVLVASVLLLAVSGALALTHALVRPQRALLPRIGAAATASAAATTSPTLTPSSGLPPAAPTTGVSPAAVLTVSPTSLVLACSGTTATLTLTDKGTQSLSWKASVSGSAVLSATTGSLGAHSSSTITVHATGTQHGGPAAIVFTSNGGSVTVSYKVSCH